MSGMGTKFRFISFIQASLSVSPKISCAGAGFQVPILLPGRVGTVTCTNAKSVSVQLTVGELSLASLSVNGAAYPKGAVTLRAGDAPITWTLP